MRLGIWFWLCLKRQMKSLFFWIQLAVLPCAAVLFSGAAAQEQGVLRIALVSEEAGGRADEVISDLLSRQGSLVFYLCGSRETLVADVEARRAECGFVFQESFEKGLETGKLRRTIELVQSPSTVAGELASEAVSASVMSLVGPSGLEQLEEQSFFLDAGGQAGMMTALYEKFMTNGSTFSFVYNTTGDSQAPESQEEDGPAAQTSLYSVRGLGAVWVFAAALFGGAAVFRDEREGVYGCMPPSVRWAGAGFFLLAAALPAACSCLLAVWLSGEFTGWLPEMGCMLVYVLGTAAAAAVLRRLISSEKMMCALIPVLLLGSLIFCGTDLDIAALAPETSFAARLFPPYYYLSFFR